MSTWTKDKPTPGEWWLALSPINRHPRRPPVMRICITGDGDMHLRESGGVSCIGWPEHLFDGALWMRNEDPADPFAETQPSYSQDSDLP